jgi:putative signal transducing protein
MTELIRTNDPVRLSWLIAVLGEAGISAIVLDAYTSIIEGSIGAIPRRVMVDDADAFRARLALRAAEEEML